MSRAEPEASVSAADLAGRHADTGFSLAETIAALVLMAVAVMLLAEAGGSGWRSIRQADETHGAIVLARSLLATMGSERPLSPGRIDGDEPDGTTWSVTVEPLSSPTPLPGRVRIAAYKVAVAVVPPATFYRGAREIRLTSIKVGARQ